MLTRPERAYRIGNEINGNGRKDQCENDQCVESGEVASDDGDEACKQQGIYSEDLGVECLLHPPGRIKNKHGWWE